MADRKKGKYYSPIYIPKKSLAKIRRMKFIRRSVLAVLSAAIFAVTVILWHSNRAESDSLMEVSAAAQTLREVTSYPRTVNEYNPLPRSYEPENLVSLNTVPNGESVYLRADAAESFLKMVEAMAADGMAIIPVSGYISYDEQSVVLERSVDQFIAEGCSSYEAREKAEEKLSAPGESEAQLGTSVEVSTELDSVDKFASTDQYRWICTNAYKYGFVIRQSSAPWKLRYVGRNTAEAMRLTGLSFDEYVWAVRLENPSAEEEAN